jgi:hypothetical protein
VVSDRNAPPAATSRCPFDMGLTHCRSSGAPASSPSYGEGMLGCTLAASPTPLGWVPLMSAGSWRFFPTAHWFC